MTTVAFLCDLGPVRGTGHVMRCVALAEELAARGVRCEVVADFESVPWAADQVAARGFGVHPAAGPVTDALPVLEALGAHATVLDSYVATPALSARLGAGGRPVLAVVDRDARDLVADLYLDQNLGVTPADYPPGLPVLTGPRYALVRDEVLRLRPPAPLAVRRASRPQVLAYFGGTDAYGAGPVVATALARTGVAMDVTVVAPRPELRDAVAEAPWTSGQRLTVTGPPPSLMALAVRADLVVSASGTSLVELACLGCACALVSVVDNQEEGYRLATSTGLAVGIGRLSALRRDTDEAVTALRGVLGDDAQQHRLRQAGWALVDGRGRGRAADRLLGLLESRVT